MGSIPGPEDPTAMEQLGPCATTTEPLSCNDWKPTHLEPVLYNKRSHRNEKLEYCGEE